MFVGSTVNDHLHKGPLQSRNLILAVNQILYLEPLKSGQLQPRPQDLSSARGREDERPWEQG